MNPLSYLKIGGAIALALFAAWAFRVNNLRGEYKEQRDTITAALGEAVGVQNLRPDHAVAAVGALVVRLRTCQANAATLENGISERNAQIERDRLTGVARLAELERTAVAARAAAQTANARAAAILARRPGANQCEDALQLIREQ